MRVYKHFCRFIVMWFLLGLCYAVIEILCRGYTFLQMVWIGGLCGVLIGLLNEMPYFRNQRIWMQSVIGTVITLIIEFTSGYLFNIKMHMDLWNYTGIPCNFMGQICLRTAVGWFFLMPLTIYVDDWLRWKLFKEPRPKGGILMNYKMLFTGK